MKGQMFIPTASQMKFIEQDKLKHQKRLEEIQNQDKKSKVVEKDAKLIQTRPKNNKVTNKGKFNEIEQENELLLGKLVEISRKKSPLFSVSVENTAGNVKSLHAPYRKKEMMRISMENEAFARRLVSQQSTFNQKKLKDDYKKHRELVGNLKRVSTCQPKTLPKKLPPLKIESQAPQVEAETKNIPSKELASNEESKFNSHQPPQGKIEAPEPNVVTDNKSPIQNEDIRKKDVIPDIKEETRKEENLINDAKTSSVSEPVNQRNSQEITEAIGSTNKSQPIDNDEPKELSKEGQNAN